MNLNLFKDNRYPYRQKDIINYIQCDIINNKIAVLKGDLSKYKNSNLISTLPGDFSNFIKTEDNNLISSTGMLGFTRIYYYKCK